MAQTYTLEEAAERLGVTPEEMKRRLKEDWKTLRAFRDGSALRFRSNEIDELARSLGAASDPGLPLAPMGEDKPASSEDFRIAPSSHDEPLVFGGGSSDDDIFSLSAEEPTPPKSQAADSDVRLEAPKPKSSKDSAVVPTEEISLDFSGPGSAVIKGGSSAKLSAPKSSARLSNNDSGKNLSKPGTSDSSEFELSLDSDSDDFELQLNTDSSDEVDLGSLPQAKGGSGRKGGESGINLRDPADSGISLEKKGKPKPANPEVDSDDFELSLEPGPGASGVRLGGPKSGPKLEPVTSDSDSEFELTLDDSGGTSSLEHAALEDDEDGQKNDIFETDFEIPPMSDDSGSEAVALDSDSDVEQSDFELAINDSDVESDEESGSQVVLLEDEAAGDVDLAEVSVEEEDDSVSSALVGVKGRRRHDDDEDEDEEAETVPSGVAARPAPWGPFPAIILFPAFIFVLLGGLAAYDVIHTMWGYQQPTKPSAPIVRWVAKTLEMDIKDQ